MHSDTAIWLAAVSLASRTSARALALEPSVLLMDKAFSAPDPLIQLEMQAALVRIRDGRDLTAVFANVYEGVIIPDRNGLGHRQ